MEIFSQIVSNPLYLFLFGSGGVLVIVLTIISLKNKKDNGININIDVNSNETKDAGSDIDKDVKYNLEFAPNPIIDKHEEYEQLDFTSDEYYITFLKTIEEKKKGGDKIEYK